MMRQTKMTIITWSVAGVLVTGLLVFGCNRQAGHMEQSEHGHDEGHAKHGGESVPQETDMKGGVHAGAGAQQAEAIGAKDSHIVAPRLFQDRLAQFTAAFVAVAETGGDYNGGTHAMFAAGLDDLIRDTETNFGFKLKVGRRKKSK